MGHLDPYNKNQIRDNLFLVLIFLDEVWSGQIIVLDYCFLLVIL